jgi:hypothetical protein
MSMEDTELLQLELQGVHSILMKNQSHQLAENRAIVRSKWKSTQDFIDEHWLLKFLERNSA